MLTLGRSAAVATGAGGQSAVTMVTKGGEEEEEDNQAMLSMIFCMLILLIFFVFFCILPVYRLLKKRWNHWNQVMMNMTKMMNDDCHIPCCRLKMIHVGMLTNSSSPPVQQPASSVESPGQVRGFLRLTVRYSGTARVSQSPV